MCSAAEKVKEDFFAKLKRGAVDVVFEFSRIPSLSRPSDGIHKLRSSRAEELSKEV